MTNHRPLILTWRVPFPQALAEADRMSARGPSPLFLRLDNAPMPDMPTFLRIRDMGSILLTVAYRFGHEPYTNEELQAAVDQAIAYANAMDDALLMPEAADEGGLPPPGTVPELTPEERLEFLRALYRSDQTN